MTLLTRNSILEMDFYSILNQSSKMETCDSCDEYIYNELEKCCYEPLGMLVCAQCYDALTSSPEETYKDIDMSELAEALSGI